jgi:hypothetical protein
MSASPDEREMEMSRMNVLKSALAAIVVVAGIGLVPSAANAANPYSPQDVCGSGYNVDHYFDMHGGGSIVYLMYNPSNGKNCVATIKSTKVGTASLVGAYVSTNGTTRQHQDSGSYAYYAGPVYVSAPGQCVWYGGQDSTSGGWWGAGPVACG